MSDLTSALLASAPPLHVPPMGILRPRRSQTLAKAAQETYKLNLEPSLPPVEAQGQSPQWGTLVCAPFISPGEGVPTPCNLISHLRVFLLQRRPSRTDPTGCPPSHHINKSLPNGLGLSCMGPQCWWGSRDDKPFSLTHFIRGKLKAKPPLQRPKKETDLPVTFILDSWT